MRDPGHLKESLILQKQITMKKLFTITAILVCAISVFAQSPQKLSYQAIVRDNDNKLVRGHSVGMKVSILQGSAKGNLVYAETQNPLANANGLISIKIGGGKSTEGSFADINWSNGPYFIKTETDPEGGKNYSISGTSQLLSVPYALHAESAENYSEQDPKFSQSVAGTIQSSDIEKWNSTDDELQKISINNDVIQLNRGGGSVKIPNTWKSNGKNISNPNSGNVGIGVSNPVAKLEVNGELIRTIAYATGNDVYRKKGLVGSRVLKFTKRKNDTKVRVMYTDNLNSEKQRPCSWEIRVNDTVVSNNKPIIYSYYSNDAIHRSTNLLGYIEGLPAGAHEIQVWVGCAEGYSDCYCETGWKESTWVIEAEEVN